MATLVMGAAIAILLLMPVEGQPGVSDKTFHLVASAVLAFPFPAARPRLALVVALAVALYGGGIELLQPLVGRSGQWGDFWFDAAGASIGAAAGALFAIVRRRLSA